MAVSEPTVVSSEFPLWGGRAHVAVTDADGLDAALAAVRETVEAFELACSSFRVDSELAAVNAAAGQAVAVSPLFLDAVAAALRGAELTDGDVIPTVGNALVAYGFIPAAGDGDPPRITIAAVPGFETVQVNRDAGTVALGHGVRLDLGATAKALAADRAAARAAEQAGCGVLVGLLGDVAMAGPPPSAGWHVRVTDDHRSGLDAAGQWIALTGGGLATSSVTSRRREARDAGEHHVIDPATGRPAAVHFRTVSVAAASCLDANIASTAAIVRGFRAVDWLDTLGLPARLVRADGAVAHVAGWPAGGDELEQVA